MLIICNKYSTSDAISRRIKRSVDRLNSIGLLIVLSLLGVWRCGGSPWVGNYFEGILFSDYTPDISIGQQLLQLQSAKVLSALLCDTAETQLPLYTQGN